MEIANVIVALGGDAGNTVPKYGVTASEIAVLRSIHGEDAVADIEPVGDVNVTHREERSRLKAIYGGAKDGNQNSLVDMLFPGAASRLFETLEELELPDVFYKAEARIAPKPKLVPAIAKMPEGMTKKEQTAWKKEQAEIAAAASADEGDDEDGIGDMDDNVLA